MAGEQGDGLWPVWGTLTGLAGAAYLTGPFDWIDLLIIIGITAGVRLAIAIAFALMDQREGRRRGENEMPDDDPLPEPMEPA